MELPYPDGNPCAIDPLGEEFLCHGQVAGSLLAQNDDGVIQCWPKCREATMKKSDLAVITACPVINEPNQHLVYRELDYKVIKELRTASKRKWHIPLSHPKLSRVHQYCVHLHTS